jgi:multicomponent Na+:H+ antiporter subunit G
MARLTVGAALVLLGLVCIAGGTLGMARFPDFYTRLHAQRVSDAVGVVIVILGLAAVSPNAPTALKLALLAILVIAVSPLIAQLNAHAAHAAGLAPIAGPYVAPRPGQDANPPREDSPP